MKKLRIHKLASKFFRNILFLGIILIFTACASQKVLEFPADQGVGLTEEQGKALGEAMKGHWGILYGENYFFSLNAPEGWVLDNNSAVDQGLDAVFYKEGGGWGTSTTVMYPQIWQKEGKETLKIIEEDIGHYKAQFPDVSVTEMPPVTIKQNKKALLKHFTGGARNQFEAIAYFDEPKVVVMVVLQAKNKEDFDKAYPAFNFLLNSYNYMGEKAPESLTGKNGK
jgi:hypothetical protein